MKKTIMNKSKSVCRFIAGIYLALGLMLSCSEPPDEGVQEDISDTSGELNDLYNYLLSAPGGKARNDPVDVKMENIQLTELNYLEMLTIFEKVGKYINLDLSECDFSNSYYSSTGGLNRSRSFNPMPSVSTGKSRIVSLVLPAVSTAIYDNFTYFDSLRTVSGESVTTISSSAFNNLTTLTSVSFPRASSIGSSSFTNCTNLIGISLLASATITGNPFAGCPLLVFNVIGTGVLSTKEEGRILLRNETELVSYPSASGIISLDYVTSLGQNCLSKAPITEAVFENVITVNTYAFYYCTSLTTVSLPKAVSLGNYVFYISTNLKELVIPSVQEIGYYAFGYLESAPIVITLGKKAPESIGTNLFGSTSTAINIMLKVPSDAEGYDDDWIDVFRGKGTSGTGIANENITVSIEE